MSVIFVWPTQMNDDNRDLFGLFYYENNKNKKKRKKPPKKIMNIKWQRNPPHLKVLFEVFFF